MTMQDESHRSRDVHERCGLEASLQDIIRYWHQQAWQKVDCLAVLDSKYRQSGRDNEYASDYADFVPHAFGHCSLERPD